MSAVLRFSLRALLVLLLFGLVMAAVAAGGFYVARTIYEADLPSAAEVRELPLQVPMRIYTRDGKLIGEFGAERRAPLSYDEIPQRMIDAFLAAEDDRFFQHPGVDWRGLLRAAVNLVRTGEKTQGGSTITMQLARNYFLTRERTYDRKIREIFLALRMEEELTKEQILETYLNKIFLGQRAYGVGAAAMTYFGVPAEELTLSQTAVLAGLPKAPSRDNPVESPARARDRRDYVLRRMYSLDLIDRGEYEVALEEPVIASLLPVAVEVDAHYVAEMVRIDMANSHGDEVYTRGFDVWTTLDSRQQAAAVRAVRGQLLAMGERGGFNRRIAQLPQPLAKMLADDPVAAREKVLAELAGQQRVPEMMVAAVVRHEAGSLHALRVDGEAVTVSGEHLDWANLGDHRLPTGGIVYLRERGEHWRLTQPPDVQAAFVALDAENGAIRALVGGYNFFAGRYNRVTQARRQPGSAIKPILFAAAMSKGYTPASVIMDTPIVLDDTQLEDTWRPRNYSGRFYGPTRLREAMVHSRNIVAIRLLQGTGINDARRYATRFGLPIERMGNNLSLALGSPVFSPLEMTSAFAVFANGGFLVEPYYLDEVHGPRGEEIFKANPPRACESCERDQRERAAAGDESGETLAPRAIDARIAYLMSDMLREVTRRGTGARARELGRGDIAGKTGTTNDETDAWFIGYTPKLVAGVWVGHDQPQSLGRGEVGGRAALPIWIDFMRVALQGVPESTLARPPGLVSVRINPTTGRLARAGDPDAIFELVQAEHVPDADEDAWGGGAANDGGATLDELY